MKKIEMLRLIADEGKILTNGETKASCVDVFAENADAWTEVDINSYNEIADEVGDLNE